MTRLSTIAIDMALRSRPPAQWNGEWVRARLVEAFRIERRLPTLRGRHPMASSWPPITPEFSDVVARGENASVHVLELWANTRDPVYAAELLRMEQALAWLPAYLLRHDVERGCLADWAKAMAWNFPVRRLTASRRWSRTSFYKYVSTGSFIIAAALTADDVVVA